MQEVREDIKGLIIENERLNNVIVSYYNESLILKGKSS